MRVIIVHGWEGQPKHGWYPWLKEKLEENGYEVSLPSMPNTKYPIMNYWLKHLNHIVGNVDKDCYFIGHSLGCITILRYLENLKKNEKIGGVVLVAGFTSTLGYQELESFFKKPINWNKIKDHCSNFVSINSDNDPDVSMHYSTFFKENLKSDIIIEHNMGHFTENDGITKLPSALKAILKISSKRK